MILVDPLQLVLGVEFCTQLIVTFKLVPVSVAVMNEDPVCVRNACHAGIDSLTVAMSFESALPDLNCQRSADHGVGGRHPACGVSRSSSPVSAVYERVRAEPARRPNSLEEVAKSCAGTAPP